MDDQIKNPPSYNHKKRVIIIVIIALIGIAIIVGAVYLLRKHRAATRTPAQTLEDLRNSSGPDKKTVVQKSATMNALAKSSKKPTVTRQQQLQLLNTLSH